MPLLPTAHRRLPTPSARFEFRPIGASPKPRYTVLETAQPSNLRGRIRATMDPVRPQEIHRLKSRLKRSVEGGNDGKSVCDRKHAGVGDDTRPDRWDCSSWQPI